ncbi:MerR family transcriptional regulator [Kitasatospora cathayae]|uniref:MerR family transcriptional regulator n=1 Tax=Kitasatospora cathayae TaxID=3004092 RepID=A0ABY7Q4Y1_9ACTN|nr:MerR family transcriptional regulator [Kitasatospora sp. HUAS 3-15]WBP87781.1 MerR family transcriptional regulator [Kitasatospora sp. HUAS 3-15]
MTDGVTISQAAAFAGVTVKTIRHYHKNGLVEEPARDHSGYRRYGSPELLRLVQVRTLAGAGVPLAEIGPILDADPEGFAAALVDVEENLTGKIDELIARRETLRQLATGDRVLLPARACALLDRMPGLGFGPDDVKTAHEGLVLVRALMPEGFDEYLTQIEHSLEDPRHVAMIKLTWSAGKWDRDDPRIEELAEEVANHFIADPSLLPTLGGLRTREDGDARHDLLTHHGEDDRPGWTRLTALIEQKLRAAGVDVP